MRIAFVTFEYPPYINGGAGTYALNITQELSKRGHNVVVFTPEILSEDSKSSTNNLEINNLEIQRVPINPKLPFKALQFWLRLPSEIKKNEKKNKFDIIHFNSISYWFLKKRLSKAKHVITIHHLVKDAMQNNNPSLLSRIIDVSGETSYFISFLEKRCICETDKIIAVSQFTKNRIIDLYHINPHKIETIYNGIDLEIQNFSEKDVCNVKKNLGLENKIVLLFVGRVDDPRKGLTTLLKSMKLIVEKIDAVLLVVGKGDQTEAKILLDTLGIVKNVIFTGFVDSQDLKKYYALCDVYICPSKLEGFGLTLLEAMVAGKPIVATKVGAIPEILEGYGTLVSSGNEEELSKAVITALSEKKMCSKKDFSNLKSFSWEQAAKQLVNVYGEHL